MNRQAPAVAEPHPTPDPGAISAAMRWYLLVVLMLVGTVSILDRQIVTILIEPIRHELALSDTQIGFITGIAFAAVYMVMVIPAARLADRWSRSGVIAIGLSVWSVMTILCGSAQSFVQLFFARFGVGFGESGSGAPSQALVGDLFPRRQRATAMSVLMLSSPLGVAGGLVFGGWAVGEFGWRTTFVLAGLPGLILAPLVWITFPKVRRGLADGVSAERAAISFVDTIRLMLSIRTFPFMIGGAMLTALLSIGMSNWLPAFLERSHGLDRQTIGATLGLTLGAGSFIGHLAGGPLFDWLNRRDARWSFWMPMISAPLAAGFAALAFVAPAGQVIWLLGLQVMAAGLFSGPMIAIIMTLAPVEARATTSATVFLIVSVVGLGLGPQAIGILSDLFRPAFGEESLRAALRAATLLAIPAALSFYLASRTYPGDAAAADSRNRSAA